MLSSLRPYCQQKNLTLTLIPASPRPIFRSFCYDVTNVLWCFSPERERGQRYKCLVALKGLKVKNALAKSSLGGKGEK